MMRTACLAGVAAVLVSASHAADLDWTLPPPALPQSELPTLLPPPPPPPEPSFEIGSRYWASEGKTRFQIDSSKIVPLLGNPTSVLVYDDIEGNSAEVLFRARNSENWFAKGFVGIGGLSSGSLDDEDYLVGQIKFSDTFSRLDGDVLAYGTIDVGKEFRLVDSDTRVKLSPFLGFNYWYEQVEAYGIRCNPDDLGSFFCGPRGDVIVPFSTKVITNEANWASLRLGAELQIRLFDKLTLTGDAAVLPIAYLWNYDSHHLREDLGPVPNIEDRGSGWGYQLEGSAKLDLTQTLTIGAGVRYWYAETDGKSKFVHINATSKLDDFSSERFGVFGEIAYRF